MSKKQTRCMTAVFLAIVLCVSVIVPFTVMAEDAAPDAPLKSITANEGYELSPAFRENTRVYTLFNNGGAEITSEETFAAAIAVAGKAEADTQDFTYTKRLGLYEITNTHDGKTTKYYISYGGTKPVGTDKPKATINLLKVLQTEMGVGADGYDQLNLDSLDFKFKLTSVGTVENTTPTSYTDTVNPLAIPSTDATENDGTVTVTTTDGQNYSEMVLSGWDGTALKTVTNADYPSLYTSTDPDLKDRPLIEGIFEIEYTKVGQYKYILEEVIPDDEHKIAGVTYEDQYAYEVTVSVVNADPQNPDGKKLVIGWIEVKTIDVATLTDEDGYDTYTVGEKVNFGKEDGTDIVDGMKYDNDTTAVTYPFVNVLATDNLHISKTVTGDLGDKDQEFLFKATIKGNNLASDYIIGFNEGYTSSWEENIPTTTAIPEQIAADTSSEIVVYFTLKSGQAATIYGLPVGATYTVEELTADADDLTVDGIGEAANYNTTVTYDSEVTDAAPVEVKQTVIASKTLGDPAAADPATNPKILDIPTGETYNKFNAVEYVNDKPLTPPTGAFVDMIPYIAIVLVAVGGLGTFVIVRKRRCVYED